jgi:hypothetical protein
MDTVITIPPKRKVAVLYAFHIIKPSLTDFLKYAIFESDEYDFILIPCEVSIAHLEIPSHVQIFNRPNIGFDFGAWSDVILAPGFLDMYTHILCINCSVTGPFVPPYYNGKWTDIFIDPLNDQIRLFGSTINTGRWPPERAFAHVQSYTFSMETRTTRYLITRGIFSTTYAKTKNEAIMDREMRMSREIINAGWNIGCLLKYFEGINWCNPDVDSTKKFTDIGNVCKKGKYFGQDIHPYEVVFMKQNSNFNPEWLAMYEQHT